MHTVQCTISECLVCVPVEPCVCELCVLPDFSLSTQIQMSGLPPPSQFVKSSCFYPPSSSPSADFIPPPPLTLRQKFRARKEVVWQKANRLWEEEDNVEKVGAE